MKTPSFSPLFFSLSLLFCIFLISTVNAGDKFKKLKNSQQLSPVVELFWAVDAKRQEITIGLKYSNASGWVGFGVSISGAMKGADIAMLTKDPSTGKLVLQDMFSTQYAEPQKDQKQDKYLLWASQDIDKKYTEMIFSRPLVACDGEDITIKPEFASHVIFAYGLDHTFQYHETRRGMKEVDWIPEKKTESKDSKGQSIILRSPVVSIPPQPTTYSCTFFNITLTGKNHISFVNPIVKSSLVHHMVLYKCEKPVIQAPDDHRCNMGSCFTFWTGWAVGGRPLQIPSDVGLPVGDGPDCVTAGCSRYLRLEIHYNNPNLIPGTVDDSGFELIVSPTLRTYDLGVITLGPLYPWLSIPPQTPYYSASNICPGSCTAKFIPSTGVKILANAFHMHQVGAAMWTQHIRNGTEIQPLGNMTHWDFNFQSAQRTDSVLYPGDSLITTCVYNTVGKDTVTRGGEGSDNEMCFNFVYYYPKTPLTFCLDVGFYSSKWAMCVGESAQGLQLSNPSWIAANAVPMINPKFTPYIPPTPCPCNSTCWSPPRVPPNKFVPK